MNMIQPPHGGFDGMANKENVNQQVTIPLQNKGKFQFAVPAKSVQEKASLAPSTSAERLQKPQQKLQWHF